MYTGKLIEDLMQSVERVEEHARTVHGIEMDELRVEVHQVRDTFIYNFSYNQELVGVA